MQTIQEEIETTLQAHFDVCRLLVVNESHKHSVPKNSETHFNVIIVSETFTKMPRVKRHRAVNAALKNAFERGMHALTLKLMTPNEFDEAGGEMSNPAPKCMSAKKRSGA